MVYKLFLPVLEGGEVLFSHMACLLILLRFNLLFLTYEFNYSLQYSGVVLFPGATLPLRVIEPRLVAAVERALTQDDIPYTIGVVG